MLGPSARVTLWASLTVTFPTRASTSASCGIDPVLSITIVNVTFTPTDPDAGLTVTEATVRLTCILTVTLIIVVKWVSVPLVPWTLAE